MALGAHRQDILWQFLCEALLPSSAGGLSGIVPGLFGTQAVARFPELPASITPVSVRQ